MGLIINRRNDNGGLGIAVPNIVNVLVASTWYPLPGPTVPDPLMRGFDLGDPPVDNQLRYIGQYPGKYFMFCSLSMVQNSAPPGPADLWAMIYRNGNPIMGTEQGTLAADAALAHLSISMGVDVAVGDLFAVWVMTTTISTVTVQTLSFGCGDIEH